MKMVKFSCFNAHNHFHRPKKNVQLSVEVMQRTLEDHSADQSQKCFVDSAGGCPLHLMVHDNNLTSTVDHIANTSSPERDCKSEEIKSLDDSRSYIGVHTTRGIIKSRSLGSGLDCKGRISDHNDSEDETDQDFSFNAPCDHSESASRHGCKDPEIRLHGQFEEGLPSYEIHNRCIFSIEDPQLDWKEKIPGGNDSENDTDRGLSCDGYHYYYGSAVTVGKDHETSLDYHYAEAMPSFQVGSDMVNYGSNISNGDPQLSEKEVCENSDKISGDCTGETKGCMTDNLPLVIKSKSLPDLVSSGKHSTSTGTMLHRRSFEDLNVIGSLQKHFMVSDRERQVIQGQERDDTVLNVEKNDCVNSTDVLYDTYNYVGSAKDWIVPATVEANTGKSIQLESSTFRWNELPVRDFKMKRIEAWVMDLQHVVPSEERVEFPTSNDHKVQRVDAVVDGLAAAKLDNRTTHGAEAAKNYISSLSATATAAQLANHGLVVIPFLSAFVSLKALNLSGNSIVRITAGALPRGLHILNLSKNSIPAIEGLRDLTRLRVLDLSYNRIFKIGHGLASCSSLKELYLAGNKISEVEGLHRLLKLTVLDLRFNKISTVKSLGQLAANYNSIQAISLEGNPAQKNVGDEQLKKHLQGLLPHMAYLNRQSIKHGSSKDLADRSARLGISAHQSDRSLRSDLRAMRKASHSAAAHKTPSSSIHGRRTQALTTTKPSRDRHGHLPPSGTKTSSRRHHMYDFGSKLMNFRSDLSMRRSRSEGTVGAV